jgi:2-haloacid dehalogenase
MSQPSFKHPLSAFVFDAYGTLLDVARAVSANAPLVGPDSARLVELWRQKQLEYSWVHALMDEYVPFWLLTERALDFAMARLPSVPTLARPALLSSYRTLAAYDDAAHTLAALRAEGKRTAVLSNGNPEMLDSAFSAASLTPLLESIISVEAARTFKPAANVYQLVLDTLAVERIVWAYPMNTPASRQIASSQA